MSKHTPEPWIYHRQGFSTVYVEARIGCGLLQEIAACGPCNDGQEQQEANARRIVACVNACAGLETEHLENQTMLGETLVKRFNLLKSEAAELTKQRDELLATLQGMIDISSDSQGVAGYHMNGEVADWGEFEEWQAACDAIAKIKGGAA